MSTPARCSPGRWGRDSAYTVTGDTVNTAHRLVSVAEPGEVLVAERTVAATSLGIDYEERDIFQLRGKQQPVRAWAAVGARPGGASRSARRSSPLVGRRRELRELRGMVERSVQQRRPAVVTVTGEPGVGKTRLALELARGWSGPSGGRLLWATCPAYGAANGLAPVAELVRAAAGIDANDVPGAQAEQLERAVAAFEPRKGEADLLVSRVSRLLGIDEGPSRFPTAGNARGRVVDQLLWGANQVLAATAVQQPTLVVIDDVQWADDAVLRFLAQLPGALREVPLVVVALAREDLLERRPGLVTAGPGLGSLTVSPLEPDHVRELVGRLLASVSVASDGGPDSTSTPADLPQLGPATESRLLEAAGGNPFLVEQLVGYLIDIGALADVDGSWRVTADLREIGLPDGVRSLLGARLDALPVEERDFLTDAAVVGRSFWIEAVTQLRPDADADALIDRLLAKGLLARQPDQSPLGELSFAHALTREVAYAAVALGERAHKHAKVAAWLEGRIEPDESGPALGVLAHHYERAVMLNRSLEHTDPGLAGAAFAALVRAAEQAEGFGALREAEEWYRRAHQLGTLDRERSARAVLGLGRVLTELRQLEAAAGAFEEAAAIAQGAGGAEAHLELVADATAHLGAVARLEGQGDQAREHFERALETWRSLGDLAGEADTVRLQGSSELTVGRVRAALPRLLRAADLERAAGTGPRGTTLQNLGWCEFHVGAVADSQRHLWDAAQLLSEEGSPIEAAWCVGILGYSFLIIGQISQARSVAENLLEQARIQSDPWSVGRCRLLLAACLVAQAELTEAERLLAAAGRPLSDRDTLWEQAMLRLVAGRIARSRGDLVHARRSLQEGLETSEGTSYVGAEARLLIELAGLEFEAGNLEVAEDRARATLALVRAGLGDDDSQLRARIVLARLAMRRDDLDEAQLQLEDVVAAGAGGPITDTWRVANAELARLFTAAGDLAGAAEAVERAERDGVETVRVLFQVVIARAALLAAQGAPAAAEAQLAEVLDRHREGPVVQRQQARLLLDSLAG